VVQCINGVSSNPVDGEQNICQLKNLILTLLDFFQTYVIFVSLNKLWRTITFILN